MSIDKQYLFPACLVLLNLGAAAVALWGGDFRKAIYWAASGLCVAMVAFL